MALALSFLLAGCGLGDALHQMDLDTYRQACTEFGFVPGTTDFAKCMQKQAAQRAELNQHLVDQQQRDEAAAKAKSK